MRGGERRSGRRKRILASSVLGRVRVVPGEKHKNANVFWDKYGIYLKFAKTQNSTWRERGWCVGRNDRETRILRTVHGATGPGYNDQLEKKLAPESSLKWVELKVTGDCEGE